MADTDLGGATEHDALADFDGAPLPNTFYPVALANALSDSDQNGADPEIDAQFNSKIDWYYGTDGNVPKDQLEFASVVLHEIGHGLGIGGTLTVEGGKGRLLNGAPEVYDRFIEDAGGKSLLDESIYPNNSTQLAGALQSNALFFGGAHARAAFGGQPVPIYAPATYIEGSSYSHVGEIFSGTPDGLMTWQQDNSQSNLHPGWVALGILQDLGWKVNADGGPAPELVARPVYASFTVAEGIGNLAPVAINLFANRPDSHWTAAVSSDGGWLHVSSTKGAGNSPLTLSATAAGLAAGYYWGQVQVTLDSNPSISQIVRAPLVVTGSSAPSDNLVQQGDMEGDGSAWEQVSKVTAGLIFEQDEGGKNIARSGTQIAGLGFFDNEDSFIRQSIDLPDAKRIYLVYYTRIDSTEKCGFDNATVQVNDVTVNQLELCKDTSGDEWQANVLDLSAFRNQTIALKFEAATDGSQPSSLMIDDVAIYSDSTQPVPTEQGRLFMPALFNKP
jgi:hypothetical protein